MTPRSKSPVLPLEIDLSDLPDDLAPALVEEIKYARLKLIETEARRLGAESTLRQQKSIGARYRAWALDDSISKELEKALVPRGAST